MEIYYSLKRVKSADFITAALKRYCAPKNIACPDNIHIKKSKGGKPLVSIPGVHFSLTHTEGLIAVGVWEREVGLDAEAIREMDYPEILAKFNVKENIDTAEDFFWWWTKKEAQAKLLDIPLISSLRLKDPLATFTKIADIPGYAITLAYYGKPSTLTLTEIK